MTVTVADMKDLFGEELWDQISKLAYVNDVKKSELLRDAMQQYVVAATQTPPPKDEAQPEFESDFDAIATLTYDISNLVAYKYGLNPITPSTVAATQRQHMLKVMSLPPEQIKYAVKAMMADYGFQVKKRQRRSSK